MIAALGSRLSLRARLFLGMLVVTLTTTAGFAIAMNAFVNVLEDELLNQTLRRELDSLTIDYRSNSHIEGKRGHSSEVFVVPPGGHVDRLPDELQQVRRREHQEIHIHGREYFAARRDVDGASIYLILDVQAIEKLEARLVAIGWLTLAGAVLIALIIAVVFSYLILRPVRGLAARLAGYAPGQPYTSIASEYTDPDIRVIAENFDALIARFHDFIDREQAFTEDAGHELRTPLAIALSANELLLTQDDLSEKARERVKRTHAACVRMQRLVAALLFLARNQSDIREQCDVAIVLGEIVAVYRDETDRKNLRLEVEAESASVTAPAGVVDCVLHNLIENAVQHTGNGSIRVHVDRRGLTVTDTGEGIPKDVLEHVFDRRYRSRQSRGLGIGLYLVHQICERLGWQVHIESVVDEGTRVHIRFAGSV